MGLVVNLFGGPGTGKSQTAYGLSYLLKVNKIDMEFVGEFAKDAVWEKRDKVFRNQLYIFGKQHHKIWRAAEECDVVVTDSPILLSVFYNNGEYQNLAPIIKEAHDKMDTLNIFLIRVKDYNPNGRNQTEEEAKDIDEGVRDMLDVLEVPYTVIVGDTDASEKILEMIKERLNGQ